VIFVANEHPQGIKGHQFVLKDLPDDLKILQVGIRLKKRRMQHVDFMGWVPRNKLPAMYGRSKIAIVSAEKYDSCPRVIPEALACGCPLLATSGVKFWAEKYISPETGRICDRSEVVTTLREMIEHYDQFDAAGYYQRNLNLKLAAAHIHNLLP
jgi:glycosyltransferase involved in cell wall biosynthesis